MRIRSALPVFIMSLFWGAGALAAPACLSDKGEQEQVAGKLSIGSAKDGAGRIERPFILKLDKPVCLNTQVASDNVESSATVHIFASDPKIATQLLRMVGKKVVAAGRPFAAHTVHHHAPVVMDVKQIAPQ